MKPKKLGLLAGFLAVVAPDALANDFFVDAADGDDSAPGTFRGLPWRTLTHALNTVPPLAGHVIHVAPGTYDTAHGEVYPLIVGKGTSLVSDRGSAETFLEGRLLAGDRTVRGFTLSGGAFGVIGASGGTLEDLVVAGTAGDGISICGVSTSGVLPPLTLVDCVVCGNAGAGLYLDGWGGAQPERARMQVTNSLITNNAGNGVHLWGAGFAVLEVDLVRCEVRGNGGWGIHAEGSVNCGVGEHPIYRVDLDDTLVAANQGGGIDMRPGFTKFVEVFVDRSTIVDNANIGLAAWFIIGPPLVRNSILWGNGDDVLVPGFQASLAWCDVEDGDDVGNNGNLSVPPGFVDAAGGDYHLASTSALLDRGDPAHPHGGLDRDLDPRRLDGDRDGATRVDMGYDEFDPVSLCSPRTVRLGGGALLSIAAPASWTTLLAQSSGTFDFPIEPYGSLLLGPSSLNVLAVGVGSSSFLLHVPRDVTLAGLEVYHQVLATSPSGSVGSFGNRAPLRVDLPARAYRLF